MDEMNPFGNRDEPDPVAKVFATAEVSERKKHYTRTRIICTVRF